MRSNFLDIFGEYISTEKYRNMLQNSEFADLVINKEKQELYATIYVDSFNNIMCLKAVSNEIKSALKFKKAEFFFILPPEALNESCFPMLLKVMRVNVPQTNGFLDDIKTSFDGETFTVEFLKGGKDICVNSGADKFLENYIFEHFNRKIIVEFTGEDSKEEDFLRKQQEIDNSNMSYRPSAEYENFPDVPVDFNTVKIIIGNNFKYTK
ncbi:MAG: hypothetical protein ACI4IF_07070, partial [Acutalibacteraceae bacterium]